MIITKTAIMDVTRKEIATHFSKHEFHLVYPHLSEHVQWTLFGNKVISGRLAVIEECNQSTSYLATVQTTFNRFVVIQDGSNVVIDSIAVYVDQDEKISTIASCDVY